MSKIGIIDADLIHNSHHNFPNLACMKLSGHHKRQGDAVELIHWEQINPANLFQDTFDHVYISSVFTSTVVPDHIKDLPFVSYGGTGFFYDQADNLPDEIEHAFPDYNLYDKWIGQKIQNGKDPSYFKYYTDFSIGFTTRGCFRGCEFCVNRNDKRVIPHSPLSEFVHPDRKKICMLDDNVLGCGAHWQRIFTELQATNKPFQFKQGLDIRMLSDKKAKVLSGSKYEGAYIFAFDDIQETELIEKKLQIFQKHISPKKTMFYVLTGFDRSQKYDAAFWHQDLIDLLERIRILLKYEALPYIMKFYKFNTESHHADFVNRCVFQWANAPQVITKMSIREYALSRGNVNIKEMREFEHKYPNLASRYLDMKTREIN